MSRTDYEIHALSEVPEDVPIPFLHRRKVEGEKAMVAQIKLLKGCVVAPHTHPSEQISYCVSGLCRWFLGPNGDEHVIGPGHILVFPSGCRHGVEALEDSEMIDVLSPPGRMGVDSQK